MQEMQFRSLGWEDPLEKEITTCSSILAWEIAWTEEATVHEVAKSWTWLSTPLPPSLPSPPTYTHYVPCTIFTTSNFSGKEITLEKKTILASWWQGKCGANFLFFNIFFFVDCFLSLYWICYNLVSVLCFGFLAPRHCRVLVPWPGVEPALPAWEGEVLVTRPPGKSLE